MGLQRASVDSVNMSYTRNMGVVNITGVAMPKARSATRAPRPYHHGDLRRGLIDAALALVAEKQDRTFSLREVARRAGVSHNAPYNHFTDRGELLGAVAAAGFERLRERMLAAIADIDSAPAALAAGARAYVGSGVEDPALYRLMFGPALATVASRRPAVAREAGARAKTVLQEILLRGARSGAFAIAAERRNELAVTSLLVWSAVHGLTMLVIDNVGGSELPVHSLVARLVGVMLDGLAPR